MIKLSGDRKHPLIRLATRLRLRFKWTKTFIKIDLWDGYPFRCQLSIKQK